MPQPFTCACRYDSFEEWDGTSAIDPECDFCALILVAAVPVFSHKVAGDDKSEYFDCEDYHNDT